MSLQELIQEASKLSLEDRQTLIEVLSAMPSISAQDKNNQRSLLELRGLGKEIWQGIDAQAYIDAQRDEWDSRP
ncbi:MAG: hypothetical protein OHK0046_22560 [Anaerolineae bacterium]